MANPVPAREGYYWATDTRNGLRQIVRVGRNGFGHVQVFTTFYRVKSILDFVNWSRPLRDRSAPPRKATR